MEEKEEGGISVGEIFRIIFSQKWLALIITVAVTVFGVLWMYVINESTREYTISFSVELPQANNTDLSYTYPDGSKFYYVDYVSPDVLNKVKASSEEFSGIDVGKILSDIGFNENIEVLETNKVDDKEIVNLRRTFSITINANAFKSEGLARKFMTELVKYPANLFSEMSLNYNIYLNRDAFYQALTYDDQINYLQAQINYLKDRYSSLANVTDDAGEFVASKSQQFNAWVDRLDFDAIKTEASVNYYLKDYRASIIKYLNDIEQIEKDKTSYELIRNGIIQDVKDAGSVNVNDLAATIEPWIVKIEECKSRILTYNNYIETYYSDYKENASQISQYVFKENYLDTLTVNEKHVQETKEFEKKINAIYEELTKPDGYIEKTVNASKEVYGKEATVSFLTPNYISVLDDRMGLATSILISLAIGVVAAMIISFIVGFVVSKKKANEIKTVASVDGVQLETGEEVQSEKESREDSEK